ncbi:VOC family protein [Kitasatospora sp. NPDC094011]|uniref:VOC family protein n=1 Tax=Kitasatospora sp. NPDC094011 TaxID=3364090 RepID=UPI00380EA270
MTDTADSVLLAAGLAGVPGDPGPLPAGRVDAVVFAVADAERAAARYRAALGLRCTAYAGPETGRPDTVSYVLSGPGTRIVLTSPARAGGPRGRELAAGPARCADGVLDLQVSVPDVYYAYDYAVDRGALSLAEPYETRDRFGSVVLATIAVPGGTRHTLVDRAGYAGPYLPGYEPVGPYEPYGAVGSVGFPGLFEPGEPYRLYDPFGVPGGR